MTINNYLIDNNIDQLFNLSPPECTLLAVLPRYLLLTIILFIIQSLSIMAAEGNNIRGIFTGEEEPEDTVEVENGDEVPIILPTVTHLNICPSVAIIPSYAFCYHPSIIELNCHNGVKRIEEYALYKCPSLERLILPGVEIVQTHAFSVCEAIQYIECDRLEIIGKWAFAGCVSLSSIDLPSAKSVGAGAFQGCTLLRDVKFGNSLVSLRVWAFRKCPSLERITIPLKEGLIGHDSVFTGCDNLKQVDLVEAAILLETIAAFHMEEWRQDMNNVIDSINQILLNTPAGTADYNDVGGKARAIREWIALVLCKIKYFKAQHRYILNEAAIILQVDLPNDIVNNNVLAFLELPLHAFDGEDAMAELYTNKSLRWCT